MANPAAGVLRWQRVEVNATRLVLSGVALALPVAVGAATGHTADGLTAVMGSLLISAAGHEGGWRARLTDLGVTAASGLAAVWLGAVVGQHPAAGGWALVAIAFVTALLGGLGPVEAKATGQAMVFAIIGAHLGSGPEPVGRLTFLVLLGMLAGAALTLGTFAVTQALKASPPWRRALDDAPAAEPPRRGDVRRWRASLRTLSGWRYPIRLTSAMAVAELVAHSRAGAHSYWVALTVALVVTRDAAASPGRAVERGLGTSAGVLVGGLLLGVLPTWGMVLLIGVIGALRPHLKVANYTAYAAVMTPLIVMLNELGADMTWAVLRERVVDTLVGCAIGVVVGYLPWAVADRRAADRRAAAAPNGPSNDLSAATRPPDRSRTG